MSEIIENVHAIISQGFNSNCYIIGKNNISIIDIGEDDLIQIVKIAETLKGLNLDISKISKIIITHRHPDHMGGLNSLLRLINGNEIMIYVHESDIKYFGKLFNVRGLKDNDVLNLDGLDFIVIHTPGHTSDGIALYNKKYKILISGDTIFSQGNVGRTDMPSGSLKVLINSIEKIIKLDVEYLLPGHKNFVMEGNKHIKKSIQFAKKITGTEIKNRYYLGKYECNVIATQPQMQTQIVKFTTKIPMGLEKYTIVPWRTCWRTRKQ